MTPVNLQQAIIKDLRELFFNKVYKDALSKQLENLKFYSQDLPVESNREDEDEDLFPYIIVRLMEGEMDNLTAHEVKVLFLIGVHDDASDRQGYQDVMHIIDVILERYGKQAVLDATYTAKYPFNWALQDTDTHPYYFGGVEITFELPVIQREWPVL